MRLREVDGAMFASKLSHEESAETRTYCLPGMMQILSNRMESGKLSTREETLPVVHMFVTTTNSTRKNVIKQTYQ